MNHREIYKQLKDKFLQLGGDPLFIEKLSPFYSLANEAKIRFEIKGLERKNKPLSVVEKPILQVASEPVVEESYERLNNIGLISEYPLELHGLYLERKQKFLLACSLKIQFNNISESDTENAYAVQLKIMECFDFIDDAGVQLNYYQKFKKILKKEDTKNLTKLSVSEKIQKRNTLRSNISKRSKTLTKLEKELVNANDKDKLRLRSKLAKKTEELENLKQQVNELDLMIK